MCDSTHNPKACVCTVQDCVNSVVLYCCGGCAVYYINVMCCTVLKVAVHNTCVNNCVSVKAVVNIYETM